MTELRRDPVVGRWVIISTERGKRPSDFGKEVETGIGKFCPFCPGNEEKTPAEILAYHDAGREKNAPGWWVRVVPNKFPALQIEGALNRQGEGMYDKMTGIGAHEVVIETPDHGIDFPDLPMKKAEDVVWAYRDRIMDLKKDARFEYILVFKNKGAAAGASLSHPHSQLIATPVVPKNVRELVNGAKNYFEYKERCVFCDMIKQEMATGQRVVAENDDFLAFVPFAARFPFETWVIPKVHDSDFEDVQKHEVVNLARMLQDILKRMKSVLDNPPYNFVIVNSPLRESKLQHYHWHLEIMPKLTKVAGFEWGSGFYINPTPPEEAAKFLREAE